MPRPLHHRPHAITREEVTGETNLRDVLARPRVPSIRGTRSVTAMLPNGGLAWLTLDPKPASAGEINRLRRAVERAGVYRAAELSDNAAALRRLSKRVTAELGRVGRLRRERSRKLTDRLLEGDEKNAATLAKQLRRERERTRTAWAEDRAALRRLRRRSLWDNLVLASAAPLFAAYGQEGEPAGEYNLALTLSLGVWLVGDELSDLLSSSRGRLEASAVRDVDSWSYVAPLGNLLTGWWLLDGRQHERFVTGIVDRYAEITPPPQSLVLEAAEGLEAELADGGLFLRSSVYSYRAQIELAPFLAPGHVDEFRSFGRVPAVATLISSAWDLAIEELGFRVVGLTAEVELGFLMITVMIEGGYSQLESLPQPRVAWMVDTRDPNR